MKNVVKHFDDFLRYLDTLKAHQAPIISWLEHYMRECGASKSISTIRPPGQLGTDYIGIQHFIKKCDKLGAFNKLCHLKIRDF